MADRWFRPGEFLPRNILTVPAYHKLSPTGRDIYGFLCRRSYLTRKTPKRRYLVATRKQIAGELRCSERTVQRQIQRMLRSRLLLRWYIGKSGPGSTYETEDRPPPKSVGACAPYPVAPRYELPASDKQIVYWRIHYSRK